MTGMAKTWPIVSYRYLMGKSYWRPSLGAGLMYK